MSHLIDTEQLLELVGDDPVSFQPIIADFLENTAELVESMRSSLEQQDADSLHGPLHQLKGSSGMLGMTTLYNLCKEFEAVPFQEVTPIQLDNLAEIIQNSLSEVSLLLQQ